MKAEMNPGDAIEAIRAVPGIRAAGVQKARGGTYIVISAITNGHRLTRQIPVIGGRVSPTTVKHSLRAVVGTENAARFAP